MAQLDLNACCARQLSAIPGIEKHLADAVIRYRQAHGGRIQYMEELWKVDGVNRAKFQILKRHFQITGDIETIAPQHIRRSTTSFICKGQSVTGEGGLQQAATGNALRIITSELTKLNDDDGGSNMIRRPVKHRLPHAAGFSRPKDEDNKRACRSCTSAAVVTGRGLSTPRNSQLTQSMLKQQPLIQMNPSTNNGHQNMLGRRSFSPGDTELYEPKTQRTPSVYAQRPKATEIIDGVDVAAHHGADKPGFTLQPSASGNNINVTCTIDKRLLSNLQAPVAIHLQKNPVEDFPVTSSMLPSRQHCVLCNEAAQKSLVQDKGCTHLGKDYNTTSDYVTAAQATSSSADSGKVSSEASVVNSLNLENMLRFDRLHRTNAEEKIQHMETWVTEVNEARAQTTYGGATSKDLSKPFCLISPAYLKDIIDDPDPRPVIKVRVEKKPSRGLPAKTSCVADKDSAGVKDGPGSAGRNRTSPSASPTDKRQISAVLRPTAMCTPTKHTPPCSIDKACQQLTSSKVTLPKSSLRCLRPTYGSPDVPKRTLPHSSKPSKSQPVAVVPPRKTSHESCRTTYCPRKDKSPRVANNHVLRRGSGTKSPSKRPLIARVWEETQAGSSVGSLLRKPLQPSNKGKHYLHQFSFVNKV